MSDFIRWMLGKSPHQDPDRGEDDPQVRSRRAETNMQVVDAKIRRYLEGKAVRPVGVFDEIVLPEPRRRQRRTP